MKWFCSCLSPHSPQLVLPCAGMFALVVTVLTFPLDVSLQATRMSQPSPVASTHQGRSRVQTGAQGGSAEQGIKFWGGSFLSRAVFVDLWVREGTLVLKEERDRAGLAADEPQGPGEVHEDLLSAKGFALCLSLPCRI